MLAQQPPNPLKLCRVATLFSLGFTPVFGMLADTGAQLLQRSA